MHHKCTSTHTHTHTHTQTHTNRTLQLACIILLLLLKSWLLCVIKNKTIAVQRDTDDARHVNVMPAVHKHTQYGFSS
eukprot:NODE_1542_length_1131_cov_100.303142_g1254_i0.p2 GENE.NODE_1542_length_1131_cov_100.303142_g1254_i0~~NODE_1542_length_1131_cov_100.303142_g1254_i0.p2  ORF type:complete len:77 (+),score=16.93 NODE_1542_length_1131_cov_100.303142_g1254_i0:715-945(+)